MSYSGMQVVGIAGQPIGAAIVGGTTTTVKGTWLNASGKTIYIWGISPQIDFGGTVLPGESGANPANPLGVAPGVNQYLQNIADLSIYFTRTSDGMALLGKGSDHYDNFPGMLWENPVFFPIPFKLAAGDSLNLFATGTNGYQAWVGGQIIFSATAAIYYTTGTTGNSAIPDF